MDAETRKYLKPTVIRNVLIFDKKQIRYHLSGVIYTKLYDESEQNNEINFNIIL